ncbi:MAG: helix-turn-helix domain-containing protein [Planctomycetota bacterium]
MHDRAFLQDMARELRARRLALGLKQVELAELANCSTRFVHTAEAGKPTVRLDKLLDVLNVLGLDLRIEPPTASSRDTTEANGPSEPERGDGL